MAVMAQTGALSERELGQALVQAGRLSDTELARVEHMRQSQGNTESLASLLLRLGMVAERELAQHLADWLGLPLVEAEQFPTDPLDGSLSPRFLKENRLLPLAEDEHSLTVAMANPLDQFAVNALALSSGKAVARQVALASELDNAIERLYNQAPPQAEAADTVSEEDVEQLRDMASEAPVIRLVNLLVQKAVEQRASDIHIEPFDNLLKVRYRIDGVLQETQAPTIKMAPAVISRIKIMAHLNIAERRLPQDGRIKVKSQGQEMDIRVSTVPTLYGESVVLRLLNKENLVLDFANLGFSTANRQRLDKVLALPNGMIMVTGPTGSGKSTTLYTALQKLNTADRKLITVEDPVEYQLQGVNQIQVKPDIGLSFANALRAIVRQDPDVIMVGEMRDLETARICVQSALTGHLVLSTLHTNDAVSSVTRLLEMGVEDYLLTSTLVAVIGQRLVRQLCTRCREAFDPLPEAVREMGLAKLAGDQPLRLYRARGCSACQGSGYHGRVAIQELLLVSDAIKRLVLRHADSNELLEQARGEGMLTMYEDGCLKAMAGITNLEEVLRVTQEN
ncbi:type II secretion system ATPase GspE [Gallaecimonas xiamenensis]|uniref:Type II secretion system protein E n=1 Tax=Gallaecimonas xiamenensis 3-C-1 TaxID=745411 RepID=K2JKX5_9GAMM|nr:general secretory pathway protein E [Gallaecimonas xiamenensis 3-C-1]